MEILLKIILLLLLLFSIGTCVLPTTRVYHIVPQISTYRCPVDSCLTLSQFIQNFSTNVALNTTLSISEGKHDLYRYVLSASNITAFVMKSANNTNYTSNPVITCTGQANFEFTNISVLHLSGLKFERCNNNIFQSVHNLTIEKSTFTNSKSPITLANSKATLIGTNFYFNSGTYTSNSKLLQRLPDHDIPDLALIASLGGALIVAHSIITVENCDFVGNTANLGGAIYSEINSSIKIMDSSFTENHANGCSSIYCAGGAILIDERVTMIVSNTIFYNNTSDMDGGVVTIMNSNLLFSHSSVEMNTANNHGGAVAAFSNSNLILIKSTNLSINKAANDGGAVYLHESNITIHDCKVSNNSAKYNGGAIHVADYSSIQMYDSLLSNNEAREGQGGVLYGQNYSNMTVTTCEFSNNAAEDGGVAWIILHSALYLSGSVFSGNNASIDGGVAFIRNKSMISIRDCDFINNWADDYGGAVSVEESTANINNCTFFDNRADYGGALEVSDRSNASISSSNFSKNNAKNKGAAIQLYVNCVADISNCIFNWSEAGDQGGVYGRRNCTLLVRDSLFYHNTAEHSGAGVYIGHDSTILINNCTFLNSTADFGSAIVAYVRSTATITNSNFTQNRAVLEGGVLHAYRNCSIQIQGSTFTSNKARSGGVCLALLYCKLTFQKDLFFNNSADFGGVLGLLVRNNISITGSIFALNTATQSGGVVYAQHSRVVINMHSIFSQNNADLFGGVIHATDCCTIIINVASFSNNTADDGGVLSLLDHSIGIIEDSNFTSNQANESGGVVYLNKAKVRISHSTFNSSIAYRRGGVLSASAVSEVNITGCNFSHNAAKVGAALSIEEKSILWFTFHQDLHQPACYGSEIICNTLSAGILIYSNTASRSGGGIYLNESSLSIWTVELNISCNKARIFGGGIHAIHSSINVKSTVTFVSNEATSGGALSLRYSKFSGGVLDEESDMVPVSMNFISNQADNNGGALYIDLNKNDENINAACSGIHSSTSYSGCFFHHVSDAFMINFDKNYAKNEGQNLFGGLLDRCPIPSNINQSLLEHSGIAHFKSISNITSLDTISSKPVRVCICINSTRNCDLRTYSIQVKERGSILLQLAAVDQVYNEKTATILFEFHNESDVKLSENEATQTISAGCTSLEYHINAVPRALPYEAKVYADGPCGHIGISKLTVSIHVFPCTCVPGFEVDDNNNACKCKCDEQLFEYIKECDLETESVIRKGVFWISTTNEKDGNFSYLIFPYCPMGYCHPPSKKIPVNLNASHGNGSDSQCTDNHGGILCGKCQQHYSLSLGSPKCIQCHNKWHGELIGIVIASFFAGIFLVALILVLNLTIAVGTLNSVIFYANLMYSARILTQSQLSLVFISWLNLEIGFDVCFYKGMDAYAKTWLQLAFPAYIIFLVIAIIWISSRSSTFSNLIGKRNPVATLATLILISYSRFLQTIIITLSFVKSNCNVLPSTRWLYDASIVYFGWKHALLFFTAVVILIVGLLYTILLFSWQWLLHCPRSKVLNWTRNQKLHSFIDTYHTPHTAKHRYWTGLLLLARVILYLISAFSASVYADPHIPLLATITVMCCLLLFKTALMIKVYRNWLLNAMDSFMCFNIIIPAIFTLHSFNNTSIQTKVIDMSVGITVILLCFIIAFHVYRYGSVKLYIFSQNTKFCQSMTKWLSFIHSQEKSSSSPSDGRLLDVLDSLRQDDHDEAYDQHEEPTSSVVSMIHSEESPSSDYCLKLNEAENQSDINKASRLWPERIKGSTCASTQQGSNNTNEVELSSYFSPDEIMRKPLLDDEFS